MQLIESSQKTAGNYWQWRNQSIYYVPSQGAENPQKQSLLLVHGFGASTDHWRKNISELQQDFDVWAIDLLGFGRSQKPQREYSGVLWREQLQDFIEQVIGNQVVLAGNSLGGYAALCVAADCPSLVKGLILLNSAGPFSDSLSKRQSNIPQKLISSILLQPWASYLLFQYMRRPHNIRKTLKKVYLEQSAVTEQLVQDIYRPSCDRGAAQVFAAVFKSPQGEPVDRLLQKLQCPLLMLWGEGDPWMNAKERGSKFRQHYPSLTEYYLKAGHCPHDEIPQQVNQLIRDWMFSL